VIGAVNPNQMVGVQISVGQTENADGTLVPVYATPGAITASVGGTFAATASGTTLTVETVLSGSLWPGDAVSGTDGVNSLPALCEIFVQLSGPPGGAGTYELTAPSASGVLNTCKVTSVSDVLNVTAVAQGVVQIGQDLADTTGALTAGTLITGVGTGTGGIGTYSLNQQQFVPSEAMTTSLTIAAQIQALTGGDLRHMDSLNLQGSNRVLYASYPMRGIVREALKGGDLIVMPDKTVWLVTRSLEPFYPTAGWNKLAITLQNDVSVP